MTLSAGIIIKSSYFGEIQLTLPDGHQYKTLLKEDNISY